MNEFTAKKLGEVLAFSRVGTETIERGREAFAKVFGDSLAETERFFSSHGDAVENIAQSAGVHEIVAKKLEGTGGKLHSMRDLYLADADDWTNPSEILEWMGFFEGAALVHWKLVEGAANAIDHAELKSLAGEAVAFHSNLLDTAGAKLADVGGQRAKE